MANPNKTTIRLIIDRKQKSVEFPSVPPKWTNRVDVNIWNELSDACNEGLSKAFIPSKAYRAVVITSSSFGLCAVLATILLYTSLTSYQCPSYQCSSYSNGDYSSTWHFGGDYSYDSNCDCTICTYWYCDKTSGYTYYSSDSYSWSDYSSDTDCYCNGYGSPGGDIEWDQFGISMTFYGFSGLSFIAMIVCISVYYGCSKKENTAQKQKTMELYIGRINEKYKNLFVCELAKIVTCDDCAGCGCCKCECCSEYLELEIELKVQQIGYMEDAKILPTQQEIVVQNTVNATIPGQQYQIVQLVEAKSVELEITDDFKVKHYTQWTHRNVLQWIMSLNNGIFKEYEQKLGETLSAEQIDGNDIGDIDKDDLHRLGIQKFKLKKLLLEHIQSLSHPVPAYSDNNNQYIHQMEEGGVTNC